MPKPIGPAPGKPPRNMLTQQDNLCGGSTQQGTPAQTAEVITPLETPDVLRTYHISMD